MNVRKFSAKSRIYNPQTIQWRILNNLKYPPIKINPITWEIFSQEKITLTRGKVTFVKLGLGFKSNKGVILVSLNYRFRREKCSLYDGIIYGEEEDISVAIINNSNRDITIKENKLLCFVYYQY